MKNKNKNKNQTVIEIEKTETHPKWIARLFRALILRSPLGIYILRDRKIQFVNPQFQKITGYTFDELLDRDFYSFVHPEDRKRVRENAEKMIGDKLSSPYEYRIIDKNGNIKWLLEVVSPVQYHGKRAILGNVIDISREKLLEEKLNESKMWFHSVTENSHAGVFMVDDSYRIIYVNDEICRMLGYSKEEIIGKDFRNFLDEESKKLVTERYKRRQRGEEVPPRYEFNIVRKDGEKRRVEISATVLRDSEGKVKTLAQILDITECKTVEEELKETKQVLEKILQGIDEGILLLSKDFEILWANKKIEENSRLKMNEIVGNYCYKVTHHRDNPCEPPDDICPIEEVIKKGKSITVTHTHFDKNGNKILVEVSAYPIRNEKGEIVQFVYLCRDITERKRAEEELRESFRKLQKAMKGIIHAMARIVETRDPYTYGHQRRVAQLASAIAKEMNLPKEQVEGIRMAALIHDIGKIYVPAEILNKPGRLNDMEMNLIKTHPQVGYEILKTIEFPWPVAQIVLQHHERLDGSGYPQGLKGDEILLEARILAVADTVEAMSSFRPYRPALGIERALKEISRNRGILYDPKVVDVCLRLFKEKEFKFENKFNSS
jgi:PAS domain S-box-containing protein/putative nucleotidyltransferase with HDIG domain